MDAIPISDRLLRNLASRPSRDPDLARAFETGEARTRPAEGFKQKVKRHASRFISNIARQHPHSPDMNESRRRKRKWGGSSCLPDWMRQHYTEGERAVLSVVVQQVKAKGHCDLKINAIAALAGVHRTTVQNAFRKAKSLLHIAVQERPGVAGQLSLTNIIRIVSGAWKAWLRRVGSGFKTLHPTENKKEKRERKEQAGRSQGAFEREKAARQANTSQPLSKQERERFELLRREQRSAEDLHQKKAREVVGLHVDTWQGPSIDMTAGSYRWA